MIVPRTRSLILRSLQYVGVPLIGLLAYDVAVVLAYRAGYLKWAAVEEVPLSLFGSAVGVMVAFRNSSSYGRWWEARTLWGSIVNNSRSLGRLATTTSRAPDEQRTQFVYQQIAWVHALRQQLRRLDPLPEIGHVLDADTVAAIGVESNVPVAIQQRQARLLREWLDRGWIDQAQWHAMNQSFDDLVDAQGGAERIKNTPMPRQYDYLPQLFAQAFCVLLPFTMVSSLGWFTPLGSTLVGFVFLTLDKIGRDLEDPFEGTVHDVPLTSITRTIEINLRQMLGETTIPPATQPVDGVLW